MANRAIFLFGAVGLCVILAAAVVAPAVSASAFAGERERGTLDLLLLQGPGPARIVLGKVLAALVFSLLLLAVGVPFFAPAWSFGGVQPDQVIALITILCTATLFFCALGVFFGAMIKGALQASLFAQGVALFLVFGTLGLHLAFVILGGNDMFRPLLWLNPFLALLSAGGSATNALPAGPRPRTAACFRCRHRAGRRLAAACMGHRQPGLDRPGRAVRRRRGHRDRANSSVEGRRAR